MLFSLCVLPIILLLIWEALVRSGILDARFFPAPSFVLKELWGMLSSGLLFKHLGYTLSRATGAESWSFGRDGQVVRTNA